MKSYQIVWLKEGYVKWEVYKRFPSESVAKAYVEGCLDGWNESHEEWIDVKLTIDIRSSDEIKKYYEEEDKQDEILKQRQADSKSKK